MGHKETKLKSEFSTSRLGLKKILNVAHQTQGNLWKAEIPEGMKRNWTKVIMSDFKIYKIKIHNKSKENLMIKVF